MTMRDACELYIKHEMIPCVKHGNGQASATTDDDKNMIRKAEQEHSKTDIQCRIRNKYHVK